MTGGGGGIGGLLGSVGGGLLGTLVGGPFGTAIGSSLGGTLGNTVGGLVGNKGTGLFEGAGASGSVSPGQLIGLGDFGGATATGNVSPGIDWTQISKMLGGMGSTMASPGATSQMAPMSSVPQALPSRGGGAQPNVTLPKIDPVQLNKAINILKMRFRGV